MSNQTGTVTNKQQRSSTYRQTTMRSQKLPSGENLPMPSKDLSALNKSQSMNYMNHSQNNSKSLISQTKVQTNNGFQSRYQNDDRRVQNIPYVNVNGSMIYQNENMQDQQLRQSIRQLEEKFYRQSANFSDQLSTPHNSIDLDTYQYKQPKYSQNYYDRREETKTRTIKQAKKVGPRNIIGNSKFASERDFDKQERIRRLQLQLAEQKREKQELKRQINRLRTQQTIISEQQLRSREYYLNVQQERIQHLQIQINTLKKNNSFLLNEVQYCRKNHKDYQDQYGQDQSYEHQYQKTNSKQTKDLRVKTIHTGNPQQRNNSYRQNRQLRKLLQIERKQLQELKKKYSHKLQYLVKDYTTYIQKANQLNDRGVKKYYEMKSELQAKIQFLENQLRKRTEYYSPDRSPSQRQNYRVRGGIPSQSPARALNNQYNSRDELQRIRRNLNSQKSQLELIKQENARILRQRDAYKVQNDRISQALQHHIDRCSYMERQLQNNQQNLNKVKNVVSSTSQQFANYQSRYNQQFENRLNVEIQKLQQIVRRQRNEVQNQKRNFIQQIQDLKKELQAERNRHQYQIQQLRKQQQEERLRQLSNQQSQKSQLIKKIKQHENQIYGLNEKVRNLNQVIQQKDNNLNEMTNQISVYKRQNQNLTNQTQQDKLKTEEIIKAIEFSFVQKNKLSRAQFQNEMKRLQQQKQRNQQQFEHKTNAYNEKQREKDLHYQNIQRENQQKMKQLQQDYQQLKRQNIKIYNQTTQRIEETIQQRNNLQSQKLLLQKKVQQLLNQIYNLSNNLQMLERQNRDHQSKTSNYDNHIQNIQSRIQSLQEQLTDYKKKVIPDLQQQIQQKDQMLDNARYQFEQMKRSRDQKVMSKASEQRRIEEIKEAEILEKLRMIELLRTSLEHAQTENQQLRQNFNNQNAFIRETKIKNQQQIQLYKQVLDQLTIKYRQLKDSQINQTEQFHQLNRKYDQAENRLLGILNQPRNRQINHHTVTNINLNTQRCQSQFQRPSSQASKRSNRRVSRIQSQFQSLSTVSRPQMHQVPAEYMRQTPVFHPSQFQQRLGTTGFHFPATINVTRQSPPKVTVNPCQKPMPIQNATSRQTSRTIVQTIATQIPGTYKTQLTMRQPTSVTHTQDGRLSVPLINSGYYYHNSSQCPQCNYQRIKRNNQNSISKVSKRCSSREKNVKFVQNTNQEINTQRIYHPGTQFAQNSNYIQSTRTLGKSPTNVRLTYHSASPPAIITQKNEQIRRSNIKTDTMKGSKFLAQNYQQIQNSRTLSQSPIIQPYKQPSYLNPNQFYEQRITRIQKTQTPTTYLHKNQYPSNSQVIVEQGSGEQENNKSSKSVIFASGKQEPNRMISQRTIIIEKQQRIITNIADSQDSGINIFQKDRKQNCCYTPK